METWPRAILRIKWSRDQLTVSPSWLLCHNISFAHYIDDCTATFLFWKTYILLQRYNDWCTISMCIISKVGCTINTSNIMHTWNNIKQVMIKWSSWQYLPIFLLKAVLLVKQRSVYVMHIRKKIWFSSLNKKTSSSQLSKSLNTV